MANKFDSLESLCELIVDCPHSTPKWTDEGIVVLRNQNIRNGVLDLSTPSYTNEEDYKKRIKRAVPQAGDIVFTREAPMGEVCIIPEGLKCCLGQRQVLLRPKKDVSGEYLFWALQSPHVQHQISWNEGTGTTVSNVRIPVLKALQIPRHPEDESEVATYLTNLASKIELNRQTNQTLEQMAQALFKSWFVDFDPVFDNALASGMAVNDFPEALQKKAEQRQQVQQQIANGELDAKPLPEDIGQLFPSEFEQTDEPTVGINGWIPKGWSLDSFAMVATLKNKSIHPKKEPEKLWAQFSLPAFDNGKMPTHDLGIEIKSGKYKLSENTVLVSKLNPHTPRIWMPKVSDTDVSVCSTEFMPFEPVNNEHRVFVYSLMNSESVKSKIASRVTGTTGSHQRVSPKEVAVMPVLLPSLECITSFSNLIKSSFDKVELNLEQNIELTKLRDTLLPKLISGELQLQE